MSKTIAFLGIDLGTTSSAALIHAKGRTAKVRFPGEGYSLANIVYWPDGETPLVGKKAIRAASNHPKFLYALFERRMNDDANGQLYGGHSAVELTSVLLREIIRVACKSKPEIELYLTGKRPRDGLLIGILHPDSGGIQQTDGIREAGKLAGIEFDACIPESDLAAFRLLKEKHNRVNQRDSIGFGF
ncbi:MAG: hypothetical protein ABL921_04650 [Pirellula sp.]